MTDRVSPGYRKIEELMKRLNPLVAWTKQFKPQQAHLTLARRDYDLLKRWPGAAHSFDIDTLSTGEIWYRGLELTYDGGPRRYPLKSNEPAQVDLEEAIASK